MDMTDTDIPPTPFSLTFQDVSFEVPLKTRNPFTPNPPAKKILHNISGHVQPGEFLGILGPSGAGKSTLLNLLAARSAQPPSGGAIRFNGAPRVPRTKRYIGYVMQDDVFFNKLTVRQTLEFTAAIRLPSAMSKAQRAHYVDDLLSKFGLLSCQHTRIGDAFEKGISGGERKRLNIANELVHQPSLFLADECTSGLDSSSAMTILNVLADLKSAGRSVVVSIHQPSSKMFGLFSNILVLAAGRVAYFGKPQHIVEYLEKLDFPFPNTAYNPADYVLELVIDNEQPAGGGKSPQLTILDAWAAAHPPDHGHHLLEHEPEHKHKGTDDAKAPAAHVVLPMREETENMSDEGGSDASNSNQPPNNKKTSTNSKSSSASMPDSPPAYYARTPPSTQLQRMQRAVSKRLSPDDSAPKYTTGWARQVSALMRRSARQKQGILVQGTSIVQVCITTIILFTFWFRMEAREGRIEDRLGLLSFIGVNWGFYAVASSIFAFPVERAVLMKDRANGVYRLSTYFIAKNLVEIPADTLYPLASSAIVYYAAGLNPDPRSFLLFCLFCVLNALIGQSLGLFASALFMNVRQALVFGSSVVLTSLSVSGFLIDPNNIPPPLRFTRNLSFLRYAYEGLIRTDFLFGNEYQCETDATLQTIYSENGKVCPITEAQLFKAAQLKSIMPIWGYLAVQLVWIVTLRALSYFALKLLHTTHKPKLSTWRM